MRVTESMMRHQFLRALHSNTRRLSEIQEKLATGRDINNPSDDPVRLQQALIHRSTLNVFEQYKRNIEDAISWQDMTESALNQATNVIQRVKEVAMRGLNGTMSASDREAVAPEIEQLNDSLMQIANTKYADRYIFSGTATDQPTVNTEDFSVATDANFEKIVYEIGPGVSVNVNVSADEAFGASKPDNSDSLFDTISKIAQALRNNDVDTLRENVDKLETGLDKVMAVRAEIGARTNRLQRALDRMGDDIVNFTEQLANAEDADIAEVIIDLKSREAVYRASLAAGARIIQPTLVDFLR